MKAYLVKGESRYTRDDDDPDDTSIWIVAVYLDKDQAAIHAKKVEERMMVDLMGKDYGSEEEINYKNPLDPSLIMGYGRDLVVYYVEEVDLFRHFDECQEEWELV